MASDRLAGKVAIITGGASGIGRACATRFAQEGAAICIADRNGEGARETVQQVEAIGRQAVAVDIDVRDEAAHDGMVTRCVEALGGVDVLVAAAGITGRDPSEPPGSERLLTLPTARIHEVIDINLLGVFFADRAVARWMVANGRGGSIVNIASIGAKRPHIGSFYGATKAGVWMLTKVFALELTAPGIRINAIAPGYIDTPMSAGMRTDDERRRATLAQVPMGRLGRPEELAGAALFLASDDSSYITGELLNVAGGIFMG